MGNSKLITLQIGQRFGRLIVLCPNGKNKNGSLLYICRCDCGIEKTFKAYPLRDGNTKSCGCLNAEMRRLRATKHGHTSGKNFGFKPSAEYQAWGSMIKRCENLKAAEYKNYGGRGITVCNEWRSSFEKFLADMGPRPVGTSLDRLDNNKNYSKENCAWRTRLEQVGNRRNTVRIVFNGETHTVSEWSQKTGIRANIIRARVRKGWSPERLLTQPVQASSPLASRYFYRPMIGITVSSS